MDKMAHLIVISARRHGRHNLSYLTYIVLKVPFNSNQPTAINCPTRYGIGTWADSWHGRKPAAGMAEIFQPVVTAGK